MQLSQNTIRESQVNTRIADDIKRLQGGSIDYGHYQALGQRARSRELKAITGRIRDFIPATARILPVASVIILLGFVPW